MAFSPIPEGTPQWDVPLNAALVTQDTQLTSTSATVSSLQTQLNSLDSQVAALSAIATGGTTTVSLLPLTRPLLSRARLTMSATVLRTRWRFRLRSTQHSLRVEE